MEENILSVSIGVLARPVATLRWVCERRPVGWAVVVVLFAALIQGVVQAVQGGPSGSGLVSAMPPVAWAIVTVLGGLFGWVVFAAIYHFVAFLLGGRSTYVGLFSAMGFAELPAIFNAPLALLPVLLGAVGFFLAGLGGVVLGVWSIILLVIAIRENYQFSTGRAVVTFLIPVFVAMGLAVLFAIVVVLLVASSLAPR